MFLYTGRGGYRRLALQDRQSGRRGEEEEFQTARPMQPIQLPILGEYTSAYSVFVAPRRHRFVVFVLFSSDVMYNVALLNSFCAESHSTYSSPHEDSEEDIPSQPGIKYTDTHKHTCLQREPETHVLTERARDTHTYRES